MSKTIFSSRADKDALAYADKLSRTQYGLSYGQYCGTILLEAIEREGHLPSIDDAADDVKVSAFAYLKEFPVKYKNSEIGSLSDEQIRNLIASQYE